MKFASIAQSLTAFAFVSASIAVDVTPNDVFTALGLNELQDGDDDIMDNPCFDKSIEAYMCGIDAGAENSTIETCGMCIMTGIDDPGLATCQDFDCSAISECLTKSCGPCKDQLDDLFSCLLNEGGCPSCTGEEDEDFDVGTSKFLDAVWSCQDGSSCKADRDCESGECTYHGKSCRNGRQCSCRDGDQRCWETCYDGSMCEYRNGLGYNAVEK